MRGARFGILAAFALAGCVTPTASVPTITASAAKAEAGVQREYIVQDRFQQAVRLIRVADRLKAANLDLCPTKRGDIGLLADAASEYSSKYRAAARRSFNMSDGVQVIYVRPGGPAEAAGVRVGDEVLALGGEDLPQGRRAYRQFQERLQGRLRQAPEVLDLTVQREGRPLALHVTPVLACGYGVEVQDDPEVNAYADGDVIYVARGMMNLAATDEELALVVAHELAHNARGHIAAQRHNARVGMLSGLLLDLMVVRQDESPTFVFGTTLRDLGRDYKSVAFEAEADYVGLYLMARAGFDISHAEQFWRKMAADDPDTAFVKTGHPTTPQRYLLIAETGREIQGKIARGEPLVPNEARAKHRAPTP